MNRFLLDSDIIIWHLRGRKEITEMLKEIQSFGLPACSALSVLEVQGGGKRRGGKNRPLFEVFKNI